MISRICINFVFFLYRQTISSARTARYFRYYPRNVHVILESSVRRWWFARYELHSGKIRSSWREYLPFLFFLSRTFINVYQRFQYWVKLSSFVRNTHYDVIGLEPNRQYNFRVRAENQYGISEPLQADEPITAKFPFTVPDPPGQPRVIDWDTSNATLVWTRPISDGGSRVQVKDKYPFKVL